MQSQTTGILAGNCRLPDIATVEQATSAVPFAELRWPHTSNLTQSDVAYFQIFSDATTKEVGMQRTGEK